MLGAQTLREYLLSLISEEKESFGKYTQSCAQYQIQPDPLALIRHRSRLEILNKLLKAPELIR